VEKIEENSVGAYSAQAAFFVITSFFPFMLLTVTLLRLTPLNNAVIYDALSGDVISAVTGEQLSIILREISVKAVPGALLGAAGISAIWAASRCMLSIIQGLNKVYGCESKRSWLKLRLIAVTYVFAFQLMLIISMGVLVFGEEINNFLAREFNMVFLTQPILNLRWLLGLVLLIVFFMFVYKTVPERKTRLFSQFPGAILSAVGWVAYTGLFSLYIDNFADFGAVYGSLAAAVILMLWLYFCMFILFIGGQFNVWLKERNSLS
jgi:membrane protein